MSTHRPTTEQNHILSQLAAGHSTAVQALAGTGKTTTIALAAEQAAARGQQTWYLAYNTAIAADVQGKLPETARATTIHSAAWSIANQHPLIAPLLVRLGTGQRPTKITRELGISSVRIKGSSGYRTIRAASLAKDAWHAVEAWLTSDLPEPTPALLPPRALTSQARIDATLAVCQTILDDLVNPNGSVRFTHATYLKLVSLCHPLFSQYLNLPAGSLICLDEAQDSSPVITQLLCDQVDQQLLVVGDDAQSINRFAGATNQMPAYQSRFGTPPCFLTGSFRFGDAICLHANEVLAALDHPARLTSNTDYDSQVETSHFRPAEAILVRTNAELLSHVAQLHIEHPELVVGLNANRRELVTLIEDVEHIMADDPGWVRTPELQGKRTNMDLREFACDKDSGSLGAFVRLALRDGTRQVIDALEGCVDAGVDKCDITLSTIHKAKGQQWADVHIAAGTDMVPGPHNSRHIQLTDLRELTDAARDELMLYYVAITRAKRTLSVNPDLYTGMATALEELRCVKKEQE